MPILNRVAAAIVFVAVAHGGVAQTSAAKPVRLVVPFAAGGPADVLTRAFATSFGAQLNQTVVVENRPGAGGNLAAAHVASSPADGTTLLVAGQAILAINKSLYAKLAYDPERDFAWIGMLGSAPNVIVAHPEAAPGRNFAEFLDHARKNPGKVSYGSNGIGSLVHLTVEVLGTAAGVKFLHVPYQGAAPQRADLLSGRIGFSVAAASAMLPLIRDGKVRALAVSTGARIRELPDAPTLVESGFPMLDAPTWFGAVAPAQTPSGVLAQLRAAALAAVGTPAYAAEMEKQTTLAVRLDEAGAAVMLARERKVWAEAVRATGATAE